MNRIGKYDLVRELGRGTTAKVYLGKDPFAQRDVAIKVAFPEILKHPARGQLYTHLFLNEASLVGKLVHPHIVQIYDAVVADQLCYIVMEYVDGGTLEEFCTPGKLLPIERVVEIVFKCTRALDFAHRLGITHRDIKPANILYTGHDPARGEIKISDFGAALVESTDRTQVSGVGSPAYMSPEQLREQTLDHHTDIYSLGVVMYQLLTGHLPFEATSGVHMVYQIMHTEPVPPSGRRATIPPALDAIVARAMSKDVAQRYPTWSDFAHDLAQAFRSQALKATASDFAESEKFAILRELDFFNAFTDVEIWEVLGFSRWSRARAGDVIMRDGHQGDYFCFLAEGELEVSKNRHPLSRLHTGDCFGEMAAISQGELTRGADIVALSDAKIVTVRGEALQQATEACRMHFYQSFLRVLTRRLALANVRLTTP